MSSQPSRPCTAPGCNALVRGGGRCQRHALQSERDRGTSTDRGYDRFHRQLRITCFQRDAWRCVDCGWEPDLVALYRNHKLGDPPTDRVLDELRRRKLRGERHLHADHVIPIQDRPELRLDLDNMATRCDRCHDARTMRQTNQRVM